ncbi:MAG TPA: hypothetical protein VMW58_01600 [Anaerolineae bacterium]|nr:hypothetical protein [Anaerolineae bacterium]
MMPRLPRVSARELTRVLEKEGFVFFHSRVEPPCLSLLRQRKARHGHTLIDAKLGDGRVGCNAVL